MADQKLDDAASRYPLPFNSEEMARLRGQHEWLKESLGGLVFAPLNSQKQNMRILDSATADGSLRRSPNRCSSVADICSRFLARRFLKQPAYPDELCRDGHRATVVP